MAELIKVMPAKQDDRVALWEVHPDHPGGEIFIKGDGRSYRVALTPMVQSRLNDGKLIRMQSNDATSEAATVVADVEEDEAANPTEPFHGYDDMTAAQIVDAVAGWYDQAKHAVAIYEAANKNRSTVLKALN